MREPRGSTKSRARRCEPASGSASKAKGKMFPACESILFCCERKDERGDEPESSPCCTQKGIIPTARWARRGGSQARTTAPDLRSGLAGVRGFKSLALRARRKVPSPAPVTQSEMPFRKSFIWGDRLAAAQRTGINDSAHEDFVARGTRTINFGLRR